MFVAARAIGDLYQPHGEDRIRLQGVSQDGERSRFALRQADQCHRRPFGQRETRHRLEFLKTIGDRRVERQVEIFSGHWLAYITILELRAMPESPFGR